MVDGGWTAAVESKISQSPRAEGVFHDEISTVQTSRRERHRAGCQTRFASLHENRRRTVSLVPSDPVVLLAAGHPRRV